MLIQHPLHFGFKIRVPIILWMYTLSIIICLVFWKYLSPTDPLFDEVRICENDDCELPDTAEAFLSIITRTNEKAEIELRECKHLLEDHHDVSLKCDIINRGLNFVFSNENTILIYIQIK